MADRGEKARFCLGGLFSDVLCLLGDVLGLSQCPGLAGRNVCLCQQLLIGGIKLADVGVVGAAYGYAINGEDRDQRNL